MRGVFDRKLAKSLKFYCLCVGIFVIGYVLGILQSSGLCDEKEVSPAVVTDHSRPKAYSGFLVVVIFTAPQNHERRQVARKTWLLTEKRPSTFHLFVVGSKSLDAQVLTDLQNENSEHGDLLILNSVSDSFSKLSKKLLEVFRWLNQNVDFQFLLKVDDDSFARLDALYLKLLQQPQERLYWGFFDGQAKVKSKGKWSESGWFLCDRYLPYAKGGGYVVSRDLVQNLGLVADYLSLYKNEDVSLGTWLAPFDIKRVHDPLFDTEYVPRGCSNSYLVTHKQSISMMYSKYATLELTGKLCTSEYKTRNSYQYNWNVLPSQCCIRNETLIP